MTARKYKGVRPDPVKLMEEMRDAAAKMHAAEIEFNQVVAESKAFDERMRPMIDEFNTERNELNRQHAEAKEACQSVREEMMDTFFVCMEAIIEDMKS